MAAPTVLLAVDIGGTFTDLVALDTESGRIAVEKLLTTYPDPSLAVLEGVGRLLERAGLAPGEIRYVVHGTTLITNTIIERKGAVTALLATAGSPRCGRDWQRGPLRYVRLGAAQTRALGGAAPAL